MDIPKMDDIMESIRRYSQAIDSVRLISRGIQLERSKEREKLLPEYLSMISAGISLIGVAGKYAPELSLVANWYTDATKAAIKGIDKITMELSAANIQLVIDVDCNDICKYKAYSNSFIKGLFEALKCP